MKVCFAASTLLVAVLSSYEARAESRVSVEVGGMVSAYSFDSTSGSFSRSGLSTAAVSSVSSMAMAPAAGIAAAEVRPSVMLESGLLFGVGFRAGQAGFGTGSTSLVGADVSLGFQHQFGHFIPFVKGMFGLNSYDDFNDSSAHHTDLRADAVIGSRLYFSQKMFLTASAFAGWGDRYGATVGVGGDVAQYFHRGAMP